MFTSTPLLLLFIAKDNFSMSRGSIMSLSNIISIVTNITSVVLIDAQELPRSRLSALTSFAPRHNIFSQMHKFMYMVLKLSCERTQESCSNSEAKRP
jgi:uncharacterized protein (DUF488 family)